MSQYRRPRPPARQRRSSPQFEQYADDYDDEPPRPRRRPMQPMKNPGVAAILSFVWCGAGQIYNGQIGKGLLMLFSYGLSILLMFVLIGFITTPILWIWGIYDGYKTAERLNAEAAY